MTENLILVDEPSNLEVFDNKVFTIPKSKVISFNVFSHKLLERHKIVHKISDNYLSNEDRLKVFDTSVSYWNWYNEKSIAKDFEFENVNFLGLITTEFHQQVIDNLLIFLTLKRITESEKPSKIYTTTRLANMIQPLLTNKKIELKTYSNKKNYPLAFDKFSIRYNIGPVPISFTLSRSKYIKFKKLFEKIVGTLLGLRLDLKNHKKSILLVEINPSDYPDLLYHLSNSDKNIVFLNRRRSAIWNFESIKLLSKFKCKILDPEELLEQEDRNKISSLVKLYSEKLSKLWSRENFFQNLFSIEKYSFWPSIKDVLVETYNQRLEEFIKSILFSKKLFEKIDLSCILFLYVFGETEKAVLEANQNKIPSIQLEHGYTNYVEETSRYYPRGVFSSYDKIALWGEIQRHYLVYDKKFSNDNILVTGSPRHDIFFNRKNLPKQKTDNKIILITPSPLIQFAGLVDTDTYLRTENLMKNILNNLKKIPNIEAVIKLHPTQDVSNDFFRKIIKSIDPKIKIFQMTPSISHIEKCDVLINIDSQKTGPSTVILEGLILGKPTMNIIVNDKIHEFDCIKDGAVLSLSDKSSLEQPLQDILFDETVRNNLIIGGNNHLKKYFANHGTASKTLADILKSY